ncbi:uncharacterized protein SAMN05216389_102203 [Oceanobacillus limi]|uniref:HD domain-containing protein n=1 Tax=Oceanobacillus limi TaxID=930131 RepID=A0A1H9ZD86_9BACI|nr:HD domain-containing protein [Oceanobacillus limi]SES79454.1 uncharacterized protein SAMN05216389_102203 [Oceanobacillus limi]
MTQQEQLEKIKIYVHELFSNDATGHDYFHMKRVARLAREIAEKEEADEFISEAAAWLHDVGDKKLFLNREKALDDMNQFLLEVSLTKEQVKMINRAIEDVSYSKGKIPQTIEGKIVQDADRIDAIGAIGIARTFAYGGANGQLIYHDDETERSATSIQHFYDKLLKLCDLMHTTTAKNIAEQRHLFMKKYLNQFKMEW